MALDADELFEQRTLCPVDNSTQAFECRLSGGIGIGGSEASFKKGRLSCSKGRVQTVIRSTLGDQQKGFAGETNRAVQRHLMGDSGLAQV